MKSPSALTQLTNIAMSDPDGLMEAARDLPPGTTLGASNEHDKRMIPVDPDKAFARMCKAVEHELEFAKGTPSAAQWQRVKDAMNRAALIRFDREDYQAALAAVTSAERIDLYLPPMMPFEEVVLYDQHGCVLMFDSKDHETGERQTYRNELDESTGETKKVFEPLLREVTVLAFGCDGECDYAPPTETTPEVTANRGSWWMGLGRIGITAPCSDGKGRGMTWSGVAMALSFEFDGEPAVRTVVQMDNTEKAAALYNALRSDFYHAVGTALDELYYIDLPRHHLVVETPRSHRADAKRAKIVRAHERPRVRIIDPEKVASVFPNTTSSDGTTGKAARQSHPRRGFTKHLTSEKWKAKRWQRIRVRPTWVGPEEWEVGKFMYKVVVRKNDERTGPATET